jgi:hypothetical protein
LALSKKDRIRFDAQVSQNQVDNLMTELNAAFEDSATQALYLCQEEPL